MRERAAKRREKGTGSASSWQGTFARLRDAVVSRCRGDARSATVLAVGSRERRDPGFSSAGILRASCWPRIRRSRPGVRRCPRQWWPNPTSQGSRSGSRRRCPGSAESADPVSRGAEPRRPGRPRRRMREARSDPEIIGFGSKYNARRLTAIRQMAKLASVAKLRARPGVPVWDRSPRYRRVL